MAAAEGVIPDSLRGKSLFVIVKLALCYGLPSHSKGCLFISDCEQRLLLESATEGPCAASNMLRAVHLEPTHTFHPRLVWLYRFIRPHVLIVASDAALCLTGPLIIVIVVIIEDPLLGCLSHLEALQLV